MLMGSGSGGSGSGGSGVVVLATRVGGNEW